MQEKNKPINKTSTVKAVDGSTDGVVYTSKLDQALYPKPGTAPAEKKHLKELIQFGLEESQEPVIKNPTMKAALEAKPTDENQQKGMLIETLEDAKPKPQRTNAQQFYDVKIPIPTVDRSLLRNPNQAAREAALEKTRAYAFSKRPDPDENKGIGSFRNVIGRKLNAATSRRNWERNNQTTYKDNNDK